MSHTKGPQGTPCQGDPLLLITDNLSLFPHYRAVEKGRYKDMDEGVTRTIEYYTDVLQALQRKHRHVTDM